MKALATALLLLCLSLPALAQESAGGWLGAKLRDVIAAEADALGWEDVHGARVVAVASGSPAEAAGVQPGDVLVLIDGVEVANAAACAETLEKKGAGSGVRLTVRRGVREKRLTVAGSGKSELAATAPKPEPAASGWKAETSGSAATPEQAGPIAKPAQAASAKPRDLTPPPQQQAPEGPQLMLDPGSHTLLIGGIAFTPDGRQLVSASDDKTIRVWDAASGDMVRTIRGEIGPGHAGKVFAMALSPGGRWLAAGGWMQIPGEPGHHIRLYDFASGKLAALLKGHDDAVHGLAFSPDGKLLISASADNTAIIWDVAASGIKHRLRGHGAAVYGVAFTPDGQRAVTGSVDHDLRLWNAADGKEIARMPGHLDKVYSLAAAADGTIASGDDGGEIRLWDGKTGALKKVLAQAGASVGSLTFSPDSKLLLSSAGVAEGRPVNTVYDLGSGRETVTYRGHDSIVLATAISPDGHRAATAATGSKAIHIWNLKTGERVLGPAGQPVTMGGMEPPIGSVGFSLDGQSAGWGHYLPGQAAAGRPPIQYGLSLATLDSVTSGPAALDSATAASFTGPVTVRNGWSLSPRTPGNGADPVLDIRREGQTAASIERDAADGQAHLAFSFTPDGETVVSAGRNGVLTAYTLAGKKLGAFTGHEGDVLAVAVSPDGRFLLSGGADRTVRLWSMKTRELLATLFRAADGEWAIWTPQGYYTGSGAGASLFGWHVNRGPANAADFAIAGQLRRPLHRPDAVARTLALGSEEAALRALAVHGFKPKKLDTQPLPRIAIAGPAEGAGVSGGSATLRLVLENSPDPIRELRVRVNGRMIGSLPPTAGNVFASGPLSVKAELAEGRNDISVIAANDNGEVTRTLTLFHKGQGDLDKRGTLYLLAVGVDKYPGLKGQCAAIAAAPDCDLQFAGADAVAFADAIEKQIGPRHRKVVRKVLTELKKSDGLPDRGAILDALGALQATQPNDTVIVYLGGRGLSEGLSFRFLPSDAGLEDGKLRPQSVVNWFDIREAIDAARGRRFLFLDTFRSGKSYNARFDSDTYNAEIITYAAAQGEQWSYENAKTGHGLFVSAVIEGLSGVADRDQDKRIFADELGGFIRQSVLEQATAVKHAQEPRMYRGKHGGNVLMMRLD